jgi:hypothetical protein
MTSSMVARVASRSTSNQWFEWNAATSYTVEISNLTSHWTKLRNLEIDLRPPFLVAMMPSNHIVLVITLGSFMLMDAYSGFLESRHPLTCLPQCLAMNGLMTLSTSTNLYSPWVRIQTNISEHHRGNHNTQKKIKIEACTTRIHPINLSLPYRNNGFKACEMIIIL